VGRNILIELIMNHIAERGGNEGMIRRKRTSGSLMRGERGDVGAASHILLGPNHWSERKMKGDQGKKVAPSF